MFGRCVTVLAVVLLCAMGAARTRAEELRPAGQLIQAIRRDDVAGVQALIRAVPSLLAPSDPLMDTPLHIAKSKAMIDLLTEHGADVNARDSIGWTPLHRTLGGDSVLDVEIPTFGGQGPGEVVDRMSPADRLMSTDPEVISTIYRFWRAPDPRRLELARELISKGASLAAADYSGNTPLHVSVVSGPGAARMLIDRGARVDATDKLGQSPLHLAVIHDARDAAETFLRAGADVGARDANGRTPLHLAAALGRRYMIELLLAHGADVNVRDDNESTPLHLAAENVLSYTVRLLIANGARTDLRDNEGKTAEDSVPPRYDLGDAFREAALDRQSTSAAVLRRHIVIADPRLRLPHDLSRIWVPSSPFGTGGFGGGGGYAGGGLGGRGFGESRRPVRMEDALLAAATTPSWSLDGRRVGTHLGVWSIGADGSSRRLAQLERGIAPVGFSPDGSEFAYLKSKFGWRRGTSGSRVYERLTPDLCILSLHTGRERIAASDAASASWSPDGRWFAFLRPRPAHDGQEPDSSQPDYTVVVVDAGAQREIPITIIRTPQSLLWSHDSARLAFGDGSRIRMLRAGSWQQERSSTPPQPAWSHSSPSTEALAWSRDDSSLVFEQTRTYAGEFISVRAQLMVLDVQTGAVKTVAEQSRYGGGLGHTDWSSLSPDLSVTATESDSSSWATVTRRGFGWPQQTKDGAELAELTGLWVSRVDGTGLVQAAELYEPWRTRIADSLPFGDSAGARPSWSPDGKRIAVISPSSPEKMHVLAVDVAPSRPVTELPALASGQ